MKKLPKTHYYKVFEDKHLTCQGMRFKFGETYKIKGNLMICKNGFHACKELIDCFQYKEFLLSMRVCIVKLSGKIVTAHNKTAGEKLKIVRELVFWESDELVNKGKGNLGYGNIGDSNIGNNNEGKYNRGYGNKGDDNEGNNNKGDWNKGNSNKGDWNQGAGN